MKKSKLTLRKFLAGRRLRWLRAAWPLLSTAWVTGLAGAQDPWPEWQRTPTRVGRTENIGPRTGRIDWSIQVDPFTYWALRGAGPVLDAQGRLFVGNVRSFAAIDPSERRVLWTFATSDNVDLPASLFDGKVLFGSADDYFYCLDADTGALVWREQVAPHPNLGNVVDENGVVYFASQLGMIYARGVENGAEVWTLAYDDLFRAAPTLDDFGRLLIPDTDGPRYWLGIDRATGELLWEYPLPGDGVAFSPQDGGLMYLNAAYYVLGVDQIALEEQWRYRTDFLNSGVSSIRNDRNLYVLMTGGAQGLYCISPGGDEVWKFSHDLLGPGLPGMSDGEGRFYFTVAERADRGFVYAINPGGSLAWMVELPEASNASPMLAPDGTLYVLSGDGFLYAFRDPAGDLNYDEAIDLADYARFDECMTDPRLWGTRSNTLPGCELLDFDRDWDADLADYAAFQNRMGAPVP